MKHKRSIIVRWLVAFRRRRDLRGAFIHEFRKTPQPVEVCAEVVRDGNSYIGSRIGLVVDKREVHRRFPGDVWSEYSTHDRTPRRLFVTRSPSGLHTEVWVTKGAYSAICVQGRLSKKAWKIVRWASKQYNLPIVGIRGEIMD